MENNFVPENKEIEQMKLLQEAFETFNNATAELQQSYEELKGQVKELNIELEETNEKLTKNLKEKEELQEYLQNVLENAPNGVIVINNTGIIKNFNKAAEEITGYSLDDVISASIDDLFPLVKSLRKKSGKTFLNRYEFKQKNGETRIINIYISKLKDADKKRAGNVIAIEDVTNIKNLEEQVERKNRLEAMGEMAAGISHEIRNPLGAIELFASLLKRDIKGDEEKEELVENIISGVKSLTNITSNLLLFTKNVKPKKEKVMIEKVIDDALIFTNYAAFQKTIKIEKKIDGRIKCVMADAELLKQVLLNLVLNAVQAMKESGRITIKVEKVEKSSNISISSINKFTKITISDNGPGMSKENLDKIFNPFFTTKKSGLGLGLAIVHKIITSHDGMIDVVSKQGAGTEFSIFLPEK